MALQRFHLIRRPHCPAGDCWCGCGLSNELTTIIRDVNDFVVTVPSRFQPVVSKTARRDWHGKKNGVGSSLLQSSSAVNGGIRDSKLGNSCLPRQGTNPGDAVEDDKLRIGIGNEFPLSMRFVSSWGVASAEICERSAARGSTWWPISENDAAHTR
jgi:hypothetical protein